MAYLYRTADFSSSNATSAVLSFWIKKTKNDTLQGLFLGYNNASNYATCYINNDDTIYYKEKNGGTQYETRITSSTRKFRDLNAWMHFVFQWDYTQATASNRIKVWINGELQTWENSGNLPPQNYSLRLKSSDFRIGDYTAEGTNYYNWKGLMSHIHFIDDAPYDTYQASSFGQYDANGVWTIKTSPSVTYGNEGFFILKDGNSGTDQSGNSNNFTVSGTITKTEDCPSNVFATFNALYKPRGTVSYNNGNTNISSNASDWDSGISTLCATAGKYYFEVKINDNDGTKFSVGAIDVERDNSFVNNLETYSYLGYRGMGYYGDGTIIGNNGSSNNSNLITGLTALGTNDIVGCAVDLDNNKMYWHLNGTYIQNGGYTQNPSSGSYGVDFSNNRNGTNPVAMGGSIRDGRAILVNFGNGYFGTTAVSSAGTNASGNGIFEFDVPTGYTALSTKGLNL